MRGRKRRACRAKRRARAVVSQNSPAELAGAQPGDVIVKAGDASVPDYSALPKIVAGKPVGSELVLEVWRTGTARAICCAH